MGKNKSMENETIKDWKSIRQISNRKNVIKIVVGIAFIILAFLEYVIKRWRYNKEWLSSWYDFIFLGAVIIGFILLIWGKIAFDRVRKENESLRHLPYFFDYDMEVQIYKYIGRTKTKTHKATNSFNKYSEWKKYICDKYWEVKNNEDFYRFLNQRLRSIRDEKEIIIAFMIPLDIAIVTVFLSINQSMNEAQLMTTLVMIVFFLAAFLLIEIWGMINEIHFLDDYMELVFPDLLDSKR